MIFPNLAKDITESMLRDYAQQSRAQTIANYERRYRELEGDVFTGSDLTYYWPRRYNESVEAYRERVKVWTQLPRIITQRLTSILLMGDVERKWEPVADQYRDEADRANEFQELVDEENDWDCQANHVYYYALGIGELALWPEWRMFNTQDGSKYEAAGGQGIPKWDYFFPWFVEPVSLQEKASEIIGAVKMLWLDGVSAHPLVSRSLGVGKGDVIEMYLSPAYDRMSGEKTHKGFYRKWLNETPAFELNGNGEDDKRAWNENPYGCNPVVFFCGPDPDETQYRGKSYVDRFADLARQHTRAISEIGQQIECLPNIWTYTGDQKDIKNVIIRSNSIVSVPKEGALTQVGGSLNVDANWKFAEYLEKTISLAAVLPAEVWDMLGSAGKVESGVALKLTMQPMAENISLVRKMFAKHEKQRMRNGVKMFNTYNKKKIDLKNIRPEVVYEENIIPIDEAIEVVNDLALLSVDVRSLPRLVQKYNPEIQTEEQAKNFIAEIRAAKPKQSPAFSFSLPRTQPEPQMKPGEMPLKPMEPK